MKYTEAMKSLFFEGRHYDISILICAQDIKGIPPSLRQNVDQVFLTYQTQQRQIETIQKDYADLGWPAAARVFPNFVRHYTTDHQILIIDQAEAHEDPTEMFFLYKPDPKPEPFQLGDFKFWVESGCNWQEQLRLWDNTEKTNLDGKIKNDKLQELYKQQWKESDKLYRMYPQYGKAGNNSSSDPENLQTTAIGAADPETQEKYYARLKDDLYDQSAEKKFEAEMKDLYNMYTPYHSYDNVVSNKLFNPSS